MLDGGEYIFVHYHEEKKKDSKNTLLLNKRDRSEEKNVQNFDSNKNISNIYINLFQKPLKIIDFAPTAILEFTNTKVIVVFESNYTLENLKLLENNIKIKLNKTFIDCKILSSSSMSFTTPNMEPQDAFIEIYINGDKISDIENNKSIITIKSSLNNIDLNNLNKKNCRIFTLNGILFFYSRK